MSEKTSSSDSDSPELPNETGAAAAGEHDTLALALERHGLTIAPGAIERLEVYCRLLWDWNTKLNLTRHTDYEAFVTRDLIDTLQLAEHIPKNVRVLDIGSGGGVPGIPLAIVRPDLKISLNDSIAKKSAVLQSMVQTMNLRIAVQQDRAESVLTRHHFDVVTARAVAPLNKMFTWLQPCWKAIGQLLLIKGPKWIEERNQCEEEGLLRRLSVEKIAAWLTPGRDSDSVLLRVGLRNEGKGKGSRIED